MERSRHVPNESYPYSLFITNDQKYKSFQCDQDAAAEKLEDFVGLIKEDSQGTSNEAEQVSGELDNIASTSQKLYLTQTPFFESIIDLLYFF
jgi:hypothetical protein